MQIRGRANPTADGKYVCVMLMEDQPEEKPAISVPYSRFRECFHLKPLPDRRSGLDRTHRGGDRRDGDHSIRLREAQLEPFFGQGLFDLLIGERRIRLDDETR